MLSVLVAALIVQPEIAKIDDATPTIEQKGEKNGKRVYRVLYKGDKFKVEIDDRSIKVDRKEKAFKSNTGPEKRDLMREVARFMTPCKLQNEYFNIWEYALEANLDCTDQREGK
ncbi:MAG: hypothetical protein PGN23_13440 [Sphingomonas adhaesiva]|uniref:hypothetical protein n=1 Tax=Sphingomonas adhaesiva TaxID=28212 RepID=UPI002FF6FF48